MGFLYKRLSEKEKKEIKREADKIIGSFAKRLSEIKILPKEGGIKRKGSMRKEGKGQGGNNELKRRILDNAQKKNKDFILAEKKGW